MQGPGNAPDGPVVPGHARRPRAAGPDAARFRPGSTRGPPVNSPGALRSRPRVPRPRRPRGGRPHPLGHRRRLRREPAPSRRRPRVGVLRGPADRQRQPRHPPRLGPAVQGHLPAVPHHAGASRRPERRLGLPRPPGRGPGGEGARVHEQAPDRGVRDRRVQPPVPRVGPALRVRLRVAHQAHRHVARHRRRLLDARQHLHRERVVAVPPDLGRRQHLRRPQGGPVLRSVRHRAVEPRARPARRVPRRHGAVRVRPVPGGRPRLRPPGVDDHAVDAHLERRRSRGPRRDLRARTGQRWHA